MSILISLRKFFLQQPVSALDLHSLKIIHSIFYYKNVIFSCRSAAILILNPLISTLPLPLSPNSRETVFDQEKPNDVLLHLVMKAPGALEHE